MTNTVFSTNTFRTHIAAQAGATIPSLNAAAPVSVDPYLTGSFGKNIVVIWAGVNDGGSAATIWTDMQTYCAARHSAGWKVVVCTEVASTQTGWNTTKNALNALILGSSGVADAIADLGANAHLQDATDSTYYQADGLHLTTAGYTVVAGIVAPAIKAVP